MKVKSIILFLGLVLAIASCTSQEDEPSMQVDKMKLVNKKWYLKGKNGQQWVIYKSDGSWENHSGDNAIWTLRNGNVIQLKDNQTLMINWEEEILELTDSYFKKKMKGFALAEEYSTAP